RHLSSVDNPQRTVIVHRFGCCPPVGCGTRHRAGSRAPCRLVHRQQAGIAGLTALGGLLAGITSPRTALLTGGGLALASPPLRPGRDRLRLSGHREPSSTAPAGARDASADSLRS